MTWLGRMIFGPKSRASLARPRLNSLATAAILLILHWALPGFGPGSIAHAPPSQTTELASDFRAAQPGHLQRAQARLIGVQASPAKSDRGRLPIDEMPDALPVPVREVLRQGSLARVLALAGVGAGPLRQRAFDARAPPQA